jgi:hypothetical protein
MIDGIVNTGALNYMLGGKQNSPVDIHLHVHLHSMRHYLFRVFIG